MANQTIFIKSTNEADVINIHRGNIKNVQRVGASITASIKYIGKSRYVTLDLTGLEFKVVYGLSTALPVRVGYWGEYVKFSELTDAQKAFLSGLMQGGK